MKKEVTSQQISTLIANADYFAMERIINKLLPKPINCTIPYIKEGCEYPIFREYFNPKVDSEGFYSTDSVSPPPLCFSTKPGFTYEIEYVKCSPKEIENLIRDLDLHYGFYDLGLEFRWYPGQSVVPFKDSDNNLFFWVLDYKDAYTSINFPKKPNLSWRKLADLDWIFERNNDLCFVVAKNKPEANPFEIKYLNTLKKVFTLINNKVGGLYDDKFSIVKLHKLICSLETPEKFSEKLFSDTENKCLIELCNIIIDRKKEEVRYELTPRSISYNSGGIH